jgi:hypothetical protein
MAAITAAPDARPFAIPRWAYLLLVGAVAVLWLVTFEGGVVSQSLGQAGTFLHEVFHDSRHLIGVPCH